VNTSKTSNPPIRSVLAVVAGLALVSACVTSEEDSIEAAVLGPDAVVGAPAEAAATATDTAETESAEPALGCCVFQYEYVYSEIIEDGCKIELENSDGDGTDVVTIDYATCVGSFGTTGSHTQDKSSDTCFVDLYIHIDFWDDLDTSPCRG
jgi:hypothetical protein